MKQGKGLQKFRGRGGGTPNFFILLFYCTCNLDRLWLVQMAGFVQWTYPALLLTMKDKKPITLSTILGYENRAVVHIVCDQALKRLTNCFVDRKKTPYACILWIFLVWLVAVNWGNQWEFRTARQSCCLWALLRQCTVSAFQSSALMLWKKNRKIFALTG